MISVGLLTLFFILFVTVLWFLQIRQSRINMNYALFEDSLYHVQNNGPDGKVRDPFSGKDIWYKYQGQGIPGYDEWFETGKVKYNGKLMSPKEALDFAGKRWVIAGLPSLASATQVERTIMGRKWA